MPIVKCENQKCGKMFKRPVSLLNKHNYCCKQCYNEARNTNQYIINGNITKLIINSPKYGTIEVLIDTEDLEKCKKHIWTLSKLVDYNIFYINGFNREKKCNIRLHRYLMNCPDDMVVDHINHQPLDNRKCNLQIVNNKLNMENRSGIKNKNNSYSGIRGVHFDKRRNIYFSRIVHNGKNIYGGYFKTIEEAEKSAIELRNKYFKNVH